MVPERTGQYKYHEANALWILENCYWLKMQGVMIPTVIRIPGKKIISGNKPEDEIRKEEHKATKKSSKYSINQVIDIEALWNHKIL